MRRSKIRGSKGFTLVELIIVAAIILIFGTILAGGVGNFFSFTDEATANRVLTNDGYTNITYTGYQPWACADSDDYHTGFTATNRAGNRVEGVVCSSYGSNSGWGKYATIRLK